MRIPAFMARSSGEGLVCTDGWFRGTVPEIGTKAVPFHDAVSEGIIKENRAPAIVIDSDSLRNRFFDERVMKKMKIRGADIWFMTHIEDADDVFDAFNTEAEMVLAPYHWIRSDADLEDIHGVSDSVIPAVFCNDGKAVTKHGKRTDITSVLDRLADAGFYKTIVVDVDDSVPGGDWSSIMDDYPSAIPFSRSDRALELGAKTVISLFDP